MTGFPPDCLLADPDSGTYEALGLVKGVRQTFFSEAVSGARPAGAVQCAVRCMRLHAPHAGADARPRVFPPARTACAMRARTRRR